MASSVIAESDQQFALGMGNAPPIVTAGSREWVLINHGADADGTGLYLWYRDVPAGSWTKGPQVNTTTSARTGTLYTYRDATGLWHLVVVTAQNALPATAPLVVRQMHSGVDSGTPGSLTTAANIDAGGTNLGCANPVVVVSETPTNPRVWVLYKKQTTAGPLYEARISYAPLGPTARSVAAGNVTGWTADTTDEGGGFAATTTGGHYQVTLPSTANSTMALHTIQPGSDDTLVGARYTGSMQWDSSPGAGEQYFVVYWRQGGTDYREYGIPAGVTNAIGLLVWRNSSTDNVYLMRKNADGTQTILATGSQSISDDTNYDFSLEWTGANVAVTYGSVSLNAAHGLVGWTSARLHIQFQNDRTTNCVFKLTTLRLTPVAPDTAGNWQTISTVTASNSSIQHDGVMRVGSFSGNTRILAVLQNAATNPDELCWYQFDPAATTPAIGTQNTGLLPISSGGWGSSNTRGVNMALATVPNEAVLAVWDSAADTMKLRKFDGTSWSQPSGWNDHAGARPALVGDGANIHYQYAASLDAANLDDAKDLRYRLITMANDTLGAEDTTWSDADGHFGGLAVIDGNDLRILFRAGTASPYGIRADIEADVVTAATNPAPTPLNFTATSAGNAQVPLSLTMPNESGLEYVIRRGTTTFPADPTAGTSVVAWTAANAGTVINATDTGLTNGTRYRYRAWCRRTADQAGTVSTTPAEAQGVPLDPIDAVDPQPGDTPGEQPWLEWPTEAGDAEADVDVQFVVRVTLSTDTTYASPILTLRSSTAGSGFEYETSPGSGTYQAMPTTGLPAAALGSRCRVRATGIVDAASYIWDVGIEQG